MLRRETAGGKDRRRYRDGQVAAIVPPKAQDYRLTGGTIPFMRRYSTIWP